jgi:monovalent cation/hydrogen antiporter
VHFGTHDQLILLALLFAVTLLLTLAPGLRVPYPIFLVLGGLALGFVPGIPEISLPPDVVLVAVLPPLLYSAAFFTSLRDLRQNARSISLLSVGLVLATTFVVAVLAHEMIDDFSWAGAFVLGAVVSPTDPLAATQIARRLGVPRRPIAIIEGESLVNDGTALVLYKVAVGAVVAGTYSFADALWHFAWAIVGGVSIGLAIGFVIAEVRRRLDNPPLEVMIALLTGYFVFIPANAAGASGVLAVVTAGVYMGWRTPELTSVQTRLQGDGVWEILTFVINALLFAFVGLQLPHIVDSLAGTSRQTLAVDALLVILAVTATRLLWIPIAAYLPRWLFPRIRARDPYPPFSWTLLVGWSGLRGAVSLAAALAVPLTTEGGREFAQRDLIVFLTFCVILFTLVFQGLTLPVVIRAFGIETGDEADREEAKARIHAARAALVRLDELIEEDAVREDTADRLRGVYQFRQDRFSARLDGEGDGEIEERSTAYQGVRRELLEAERSAIYALRRDRVINDDVMHRLTRDIDLEEARLDI